MDVKLTKATEFIPSLLPASGGASTRYAFAVNRAPNASRSLNPHCLQLSLQLILLCSFISFTFINSAFAEPADAEFYHQLLKVPQATGYQPTRSFTIVIDTENGNQLIADDDATLRFNQLWLQQFQTGNEARRGGAAFGEIFRSFFKQVYRNYRDSHAEDLSAYPDENGSIKHNSYSTSMDYNLKVTDDEVRFKIQYSY